jgi:hypothetical protein
MTWSNANIVEVDFDCFQRMGRWRGGPVAFYIMTPELIVGGVDAAAGVELAKAWFSGWSVAAPSVSTYKAAPLTQAPRPSTTKVDVLDTGAGDRADLYLGCRLDADAGVLAVAREAVLQGLRGGIDGVVVTTDAWEGGTAILQVRARLPAVSFDGSTLPTSLPWRSTVARSQSARTSSRRWLM